MNLSAMSVADDEVKIAPYGSWKSPVSSKVVSRSSISFQDLRVDPKNPGIQITYNAILSHLKRIYVKFSTKVAKFPRTKQ